MLKQLLLFVLLFTQSFSNKISCSNYDFMELQKLENTDWIPVKWNTGHCYFHNVVTKEDVDILPEDVHMLSEENVEYL